MKLRSNRSIEFQKAKPDSLSENSCKKGTKRKYEMSSRNEDERKRRGRPRKLHLVQEQGASKSSDVNTRVDESSRVPKPSRKRRERRKRSREVSNGKTIFNCKRNLLSWMIDSRVILEGWKVRYGKSTRRKRAFEGTITVDGIHCSYCNDTMGISRFVLHAGGHLSYKFDNLYLESGPSLRECLLQSWKKESNGVGFNLIDINGDDKNDDSCNICGDGGDLVCCDGCPSTFHQTCLNIQKFPSRKWYCTHCLCKFCRKIAGVHKHRGAFISEMYSCSLCERKFHRSCVHEANAVNLESDSVSFCGRTCQQIYEQLQTKFGMKKELEDGFSFSLLRRFDISKTRIASKIECNSKLAVAYSVMDECFHPIVDQISGVDMIKHMVYNSGSNFRRLHYAGFFMAILEKDHEMISVASIRIHGSELAEMPFIGTRQMYREKGMCSRLLDSIESVLGSLGVGELVMPAAPEVTETWINRFGFKPLEETTRQTMRTMSMAVFPGTDMLQKHIPRN